VRPEDADLAWAGATGELEDLQAGAVTWLRRAAQLAIGRFEIDDGLALLHRALPLESDVAARVALWREIGRANVFKFDGEAFWTAMQNSLEGSDQATAADTYSLLAFHTATRAAMWKRRPDRKLIKGWIERALELSEAETAARARAMIARTYFGPEGYGDAAQPASELADRLGDMELRSWAWGARQEAAFALGDYEEAFAWARRRFDIVPELTDPDHIALIYMFGLDACIVTGRLEEARRIVEAHDEVTRSLTPHHRMHAVEVLIVVEHAAGRWTLVRDFTPRAETAVAANIATPCVSSAVSLLSCALANVQLGNDQEARRLERTADDLGMEGYGRVLDPLRVEIAVARGAPTEVERLLGELGPRGLDDPDGLIARLGALVALGRRTEIEDEAPTAMKPGTYLEPFALRALGFARNDEGLIAQAVQSFEAMGLAWHAAETRDLLRRV
jgi:tetratricopeptide (TPR) repeat protein